jgi:Ca2+-binding EF-hand superfamily protein
VESKKSEKFIEIFNKLDNDDDGLISANKISIEKLDEKILMMVSPVLIEMEEIGLELDFKQFNEALDKLYEVYFFTKFLFSKIMKKKEDNCIRDLV